MGFGSGAWGADHFGAGDVAACILATRPSSASLSGGQTVMVASDSPLTDFEFDFRTSVLPTGWTSALVGSGAVTTSATGAILETGTTNNSIAAVELSDASHFVATVEFEILYPGNAGGNAELAFLEHISDGENRISGVRVRDFGNQRLAAFDYQAPNGTVTPGGVQSWDTSSLGLVLVRTDEAIWGFILSEDRAWMPLGTLAETGTGFGKLRFGVKTNAANKNQRARLTKISLETGASLGGILGSQFLLMESTAFQFVTPSLPFANFGNQPLAIFGPSFGRATTLFPCTYPRKTSSQSNRGVFSGTRY